MSAGLSRRAFFRGAAALALAACSGPSVTRKPRRIGWLSGNGVESVESLSRPFYQEMGDLGYVEGLDVVFERRIADTRTERLPGMADELVALPVDVLIAEAGPAQGAARDATKTIPIVFVTAADPIGLGLVASLAHPGGNATGVTTGSILACAKRVEYLKEAVPSLASLAILWNANQPDMIKNLVPATAEAARTLHIEPRVFAVRNTTELLTALDTIARDHLDGLVLLPALSVIRGDFQLIPEYAARFGIAQSYADEDIVRSGGGLMSFNSNRPAQYRRAARFVDKILRGASPADLPVEEPTEFDFVINLKMAQRLGVTVPESVVRQATDVVR